MSTETLSFVLLASIVGMGIVFIFLTMLSLLMVLIKGVDRVAPASGDQASDSVHHLGARRAPAPAGESRAPSGVPTLPVWAVAAVAAYLEAERDAVQSSASVWTKRTSR